MLTKRQELLTKIKEQYCEGKITLLAQAIDKNYSYVHRLFLDESKRGYKGIGLEIMDACTRAFDLPAGFWDGADEAPDGPQANRPALPRELPLQSPYARLLANTFDTLGMDPATAKQAFVAATQVLIDHSNRGNGPAIAAPARADAAPNRLTERPSPTEAGN